MLKQNLKVIAPECLPKPEYLTENQVTYHPEKNFYSNTEFHNMWLQQALENCEQLNIANLKVPEMRFEGSQWEVIRCRLGYLFDDFPDINKPNVKCLRYIDKYGKDELFLIPRNKERPLLLTKCINEDEIHYTLSDYACNSGIDASPEHYMVLFGGLLTLVKLSQKLSIQTKSVVLNHVDYLLEDTNPFNTGMETYDHCMWCFHNMRDLGDLILDHKISDFDFN